MAELSEVLGALMVSLVHARRMADEETAAVAEYYKDNPLLEGMSLPRVRVPQLTIDMPITIDGHVGANTAELNSPAVIHKAVLDELKQHVASEGLEASSMRKFQATFNTDAKTALERVSKLEQQKQGQVSREAIVRVVDDALQSAMKKSGLNNELQNTQKSNLIQSIRQRVSSVSLKKISNPTSLKASAITSEVKEKSTHESSVRLSITLREEGLEWSTSETESGSIRNRLQPE
ncbi:MAG: amidase [Thalassolituus sp.]|jgi:hypothetical protein|uniref:Amidase n=1 Tax=Thalassolituus oleivorans MIL-1 TaxID=1298593 RepID=M5DN62_9GAMM|nr:hypothetical protein [Thalassolituus oleivorans]PCI48132.1 MAG: amidase [Oceanospirillales bacterium]AHK14863.1 amidase [Thalassolituus oleivorans R6-15]MBQ0727975.1 amidase [Thalassolituus oleivorans]MBQ0779614.1 amidase [Thalassolituus oleivorans]PCI48400.1 MAG: amidase [Oceanospirillales bacterium]